MKTGTVKFFNNEKGYGLKPQEIRGNKVGVGASERPIDINIFLHFLSSHETLNGHSSIDVLGRSIAKGVQVPLMLAPVYVVQKHHHR